MPAFSQTELEDLLGYHYHEKLVTKNRGVVRPVSSVPQASHSIFQPSSPHGEPTAHSSLTIRTETSKTENAEPHKISVPFQSLSPRHDPTYDGMGATSSTLRDSSATMKASLIHPPVVEDKSVRRAVGARNSLLKSFQSLSSPSSPQQERERNDVDSKLLADKSVRSAVYQQGYSSTYPHDLSSSNSRERITHTALHPGTMDKPFREDLTAPTRYGNKASPSASNEYFEGNLPSIVPGTFRPSQHLSHTSRVQAFNTSRNIVMEYESDPEDLTAYIPASSSFAVVIPPRVRSPPQELISLPYNEATARNSWSHDQRRTLAFMRWRFTNGPPEQAKIFSALFQTELSLFGLENGMGPAALVSQWNHMKSGRDGYNFWRSFNISSMTWDRNLSDLQERILETATQLGITLDIRILKEESAKKHGHRMGKKLPKYTTHRHGVRRSISYPTDLPKRRRQIHEAGPEISTGYEQDPVFNSLLTSAAGPGSLLPRNPRIKCQEPYAVPKLGFRWYNFQSQGVNGPRRIISGLHSESSASLDSPEPESEEFKLAVYNHMNRVHTLSPFISVFKSILPCLHRALNNGDSAGISIIDLEGCNNDLKLRLRTDQECVFSAGKLVKKFGFILPGNYSAGTEFLIYGDVLQRNILCTFSRDTLFQIATTRPEMGAFLQVDVISSHLHCTPKLKRLIGNKRPLNDQTGRMVGKLLRHLNAPELTIEDIACNIARAWRFTGKIWNDYIAGVKIGYAMKQERNFADKTATVVRPFGRLADVPSSANIVHMVRKNTEASPFTQDTNDLPNTEQENPSSIARNLNSEQALFDNNILDLTDVDVTNPFDVDLELDDNTDDNTSQPVGEKVQQFLDGLEAAAGQFENMDTAIGHGTEINAERVDNNSKNGGFSQLERHAGRKGMQFRRAPEWNLESIGNLFVQRSEPGREPTWTSASKPADVFLGQCLSKRMRAMNMLKDDESRGSGVRKRPKEMHEDPFAD